MIWVYLSVHSRNNGDGESISPALVKRCAMERQDNSQKGDGFVSQMVVPPCPDFLLPDLVATVSTRPHPQPTKVAQLLLEGTFISRFQEVLLSPRKVLWIYRHQATLEVRAPFLKHDWYWFLSLTQPKGPPAGSCHEGGRNPMTCSGSFGHSQHHAPWLALVREHLNWHIVPLVPHSIWRCWMFANLSQWTINI